MEVKNRHFHHACKGRRAKVYFARVVKRCSSAKFQSCYHLRKNSCSVLLTTRHDFAQYAESVCLQRVTRKTAMKSTQGRVGGCQSGNLSTPKPYVAPAGCSTATIRPSDLVLKCCEAIPP